MASNSGWDNYARAAKRERGEVWDNWLWVQITNEAETTMTTENNKIMDTIYPTITILGLEEVKRLRQPKFDFLLSILSPDDMLFPPLWIPLERYYSLTFADITEPQISSGIYVPPSRKDVQEILSFGRKVLEAQKDLETPLNLLIHCTAGISRSTAAGFMVWCDWLGEGREREALKAVLAVRPIAMPNRLMVAYADEMLGRHGKMVEVAGLINY